MDVESNVGYRKVMRILMAHVLCALVAIIAVESYEIYKLRLELGRIAASQLDDELIAEWD